MEYFTANYEAIVVICAALICPSLIFTAFLITRAATTLSRLVLRLEVLASSGAASSGPHLRDACDNLDRASRALRRGMGAPAQPGERREPLTSILGEKPGVTDPDHGQAMLDLRDVPQTRPTMRELEERMALSLAKFERQMEQATKIVRPAGDSK